MEHYGGFWRRVGAYLIDVIIVSIASSVIGGVFGVASGVEAALSGDEVAAVNPMANLLGLAIGIAYFAGLESSSMQATLGKKLLGMVVTDLAGNRISFARALGRYFAKILSGVILLIGYIMVGLTERKQGLHDMIAGTLVHVGPPGGSHASTFE
jgi:uncharacterized RDD family membrane protein YckC